MAQFPWKKGWKGTPVAEDPERLSQRRKSKFGSPLGNDGKRPENQTKLPTDTAREYGGELAKEYWKRGIKKF